LLGAQKLLGKDGCVRFMHFELQTAIIDVDGVRGKKDVMSKYLNSLIDLGWELFFEDCSHNTSPAMMKSLEHNNIHCPHSVDIAGMVLRIQDPNDSQLSKYYISKDKVQTVTDSMLDNRTGKTEGGGGVEICQCSHDFKMQEPPLSAV